MTVFTTTNRLMKALAYLGEAFEAMGKARELFEKNEPEQAMEMMRPANADLVRWVHVLTKSEKGDWIAELNHLRNERKSFEKAIADCVKRECEDKVELEELRQIARQYKRMLDAALPFQVGGEFEELLVVGDNTVEEGLKRGIEALCVIKSLKPQDFVSSLVYDQVKAVVSPEGVPSGTSGAAPSRAPKNCQCESCSGRNR